jgi:geranylgeranyl diphosphate synthase type II
MATHAASTPGPYGSLEAGLEARRREVEAELVRIGLPGEAEEVRRAAEDSLFAPGKRLRPILAMMVAELLRGDASSALPAGCAVEMTHTASLILDDLPCMDDARARRGRPACHVRFGEATAILAAFALLNRAFEVLANGWPRGPGADVRMGLAGELAAAVGLSGLIAGQAKDLLMTDRAVDFATLEFIHSRKAGVLFVASAMLGARVAAAGAGEAAALRAYAKNLGLAFQIVDDLLDVEGGAEVGKDLGRDVKKTTFVSFSGAKGARQLAAELAAAAGQALAGFGARAAPLRELAGYVVARRR